MGRVLRRNGLLGSQFACLAMGCGVFVFLVIVHISPVQAQDTLPEEVQQETEEQKKEREKKEKEEKEKEEKEEEEKELKKDAQKLEEKLDKAQKEKDAKQQRLNAQYNELNKQRYALEKTKTEVEAKEAEITAKSNEIVAVEGRITLNKASLAATMRQLYFERSYSVVSHIYQRPGGDQFLRAQDHIDRVRENIVVAVADMDREKESLTQSREELDKAKKEKEELLKDQEKKEVVLEKTAAATNIQVKEVEATISEINGKLSGIQSKLSDLLGVGLSTDDIVEAAEFASKKTGVRKGFLLGMLIVETDLGRFTGGCTYKQSRMNETRKKDFKIITKELGYDYKTQKVSCPPSKYKGTGGAMGVAQFMPDTWQGYKSVIAKRTGNNPPDPWNLVDGVMAMASKLANDGAKKKDGEWNAAARYLGSCRGNTKFYCENVLYWADNYEKKL